MSVHKPQDLRRYEHYRKKDGVIVIKYGAEWCGPCKRIMPDIIKLAKEYPDVYFLDVDVDNDDFGDHPDFNDVKTLPTFKVFIDQKLIREVRGADYNRVHRYVSRYSKPQLPIATNDNNDNDMKEIKYVVTRLEGADVTIVGIFEDKEEAIKHVDLSDPAEYKVHEV